MIKPTRRPARWKLLVAVLVSAMAACGAPTYTYVKNSNEHLYFKVPHEWRKVRALDPIEVFTPLDPASMEEESRQVRRVWSVAYDADRTGDKPDVLFGNDGAPFVYAKVQVLDEDEKDAISLDTMRDLIMPVTEAERAKLDGYEQRIKDAVKSGVVSAEQAQQASTGLHGFEQVVDKQLSPGGGLRGVRTVYNYYNDRWGGGTLHTFDQTVMLSADASRIYLFVISCAAAYYRDHFDQLNTIATSFTVRSR